MLVFILFLKEVLFWWMFIYVLLILFSQTIRTYFINWLKKLNKPYSLKTAYSLDAKYDYDLQKEMENMVIKEIREDIDNEIRGKL